MPRTRIELNSFELRCVALIRPKRVTCLRAATAAAVPRPANSRVLSFHCDIVIFQHFLCVAMMRWRNRICANRLRRRCCYFDIKKYLNWIKFNTYVLNWIRRRHSDQPPDARRQTPDATRLPTGFGRMGLRNMFVHIYVCMCMCVCISLQKMLHGMAAVLRVTSKKSFVESFLEFIYLFWVAKN